jgi:hypothetical protein
MKRFWGTPEAIVVLNLRFDAHHCEVQTPPPRRGISPAADIIAKAVAASGAEPGDIIEIDQHGAARVVGRRPRIVDEKGDSSERAVRARLTALYGARLVKHGRCSVRGETSFVFRTPTQI